MSFSKHSPLNYPRFIIIKEEWAREREIETISLRVVPPITMKIAAESASIDGN
jgi:hypothetical protein